jgi:hypothetical protein
VTHIGEKQGPIIAPAILPSQQLPNRAMTIATMETRLASRRMPSRIIATHASIAGYERLRDLTNRRNEPNAFSTIFPPQILSQSSLHNPFSQHNLRTAIDPFPPPLTLNPPEWVSRLRPLFYSPKCPVSRLFLGHRGKRKKCAQAAR